MATADEAKGRIKEAAGDLTDNDDLKNEGKADQVGGKIKDAVDTVKDKLTGKSKSIRPVPSALTRAPVRARRGSGHRPSGGGVRVACAARSIEDDGGPASTRATDRNPTVADDSTCGLVGRARRHRRWLHLSTIPSVPAA